MRWNRRQFVRSLGATAFGAVLLPLPWPRARSGPAIAVVGAGDAGDFGRGALLGIEEARRSAELLRRPLELVAVAEEEVAAAAPAGEDLAAWDVLALVAALPDDAQTALERSAAAAGLVVLDARAVRPEAPGRSAVFRTGLPVSAYAAALDRAAPAGADAAGDPRAVLWHHGLFRYGAEQLNERYRRRFDAGMTGEAWAGWMAVKAVSEAALRAGDGGRAALLERLAGPRAAFDGHKGAPLSFTAPGGALAQPLYVVRGGETEEVAWPMEERR